MTKVKTTFAPGYKADCPRETRVTKTGVTTAAWRERKKEAAA